MSSLSPQEIELRLAEIRSQTDGWIARTLNKPVSFAITRRLLKTTITPNQITAVNVFLALVAASCVAWGEYGLRCVGALLIQFHSVLDGCDGEVARLKGSTSKFGAWFDTLADDFSNNLFFAALVCGLWLSGQKLWVLVFGVGVLCESLGISAIILHYLVTVAGTGRAQDFRLAWETHGSAAGEVRAPTFYSQFMKPLLKRDFFLFLMALSILLDLRLPFLLVAGVGVTVGFIIYATSFTIFKKHQAGRR